MNHVTRRDRYAEETALIRQIVSRHPLPDVVTGFDVRLGEFDGDPAMWIVFKMVRRPELPYSELKPELQVLRALTDAVQADLLDSIDDRFPYVRLE